MINCSNVVNVQFGHFDIENTIKYNLKKMNMRIQQNLKLPQKFTELNLKYLHLFYPPLFILKISDPSKYRNFKFKFTLKSYVQHPLS